MSATIHIIHENDEWTKPLRQALDALNVPYEDWHLHEGTLDLSKEPPKGIFYNRMSASSHTRDHRFAPEYTAAVLSWLEAHDRIVFNNSRALALEVSKVAQYTALQAHGIQTPKTMAVVGKAQLLEAASHFDGAFITKHNRAGKGLGVQLFQHPDALKSYLTSDDFEEPIDGITLLQQYIQSPNAKITRCEFIGGKFFYAVDVDTSDGFELCPADACQIGDTFCPTTATPKPKFVIRESFDHPIIEKYERFLQANGITFAGIEFIQDAQGTIYTYDVNTNTNYNKDAEQVAGLYGMTAIANHLANALHSLTQKA
ncbi:ATP-grasp domain-containing protein [Metabacillus iocasae]|uniref:Glutathione synthase/RimK-type ligase-like ATP-grasp enzyme n=1 Tax=Priestia iocasae TaxID=2291674 RepID=A0ABS2QWJ3_9BACI|nr:alpha-L-glutamate ligase [Metabacillus iocasae]MBM7703126.1 glutathione synthase/RimK-type ligase-like ATP-grasp enzyme [Metabacillus iocasae]